MTYIRHASRCANCSLRDQTRVWSAGSFTSGIAVCGEAPGADEAASGKPFVGIAGQTLRKALGHVSINPETVWYLNLICCRPPNNKLDGFEGQDALANCRPGLNAEIKWLEEQGVKLVILAGAEPTHAFGIEGAIGKVRGSVYEKRENL